MKKISVPGIMRSSILQCILQTTNGHWNLFFRVSSSSVLLTNLRVITAIFLSVDAQIVLLID